MYSPPPPVYTPEVFPPGPNYYNRDFAPGYNLAFAFRPSQIVRDDEDCNGGGDYDDASNDELRLSL